MTNAVCSAEPDVAALHKAALRSRGRVLRLAARGGCFVGSALSCLDILIYLYTSFLRISPDRRHDPGRDYLFLSKGHAVPALYAVLAETGFFDPSRLVNHLSVHDSVYWHPNTEIPGVEFHSGSLGHGVAVAAGVALDVKLRAGRNRVVVITGDGELNEGSVWESLRVAASFRLDNLIIVIDRNGLQANGGTEDLAPLEPLAAKLLSFGLSVQTVNGHDFRDLAEAFGRVPIAPGRPNAIIANTVRGKGIPSLENRVDQWFCTLTPEREEELLCELEREASACRP